MISHEHKCIFIHIPRCAGSSMELALEGKSVFNRSKKHLLATTAKRIYKDYWDDYFKFSFVRNPWDRTVSLSRWPSFYGCRVREGKLLIKGLKNLIIDPRSKSKFDRKKLKFKKNAVYLNILNEEIDFIGRFENLQADWLYVCKQIGLEQKPLGNIKKYKTKLKYPHRNYYTTETKNIVHETYQEDINFFNYKFEY